MATQDYLQTGFTGTFSLSSTGLIQGFSQKSPTQNNKLEAGVFSPASASEQIWAGTPVQIFIPAPSGGIPNFAGPALKQSDTNAHIMGWSTYDGADYLPISQQSNAPLYGSGMSMQFYRNGVGVVVYVPIDDTLAATLLNGSTLENVQVSWDFTNKKIITYNSGIGALAAQIVGISTSNNELVSYNATTGNAVWASQGTADSSAGSPVVYSSIAAILI